MWDGGSGGEGGGTEEGRTAGRMLRKEAELDETKECPAEG